MLQICTFCISILCLSVYFFIQHGYAGWAWPGHLTYKQSKISPREKIRSQCNITRGPQEQKRCPGAVGCGSWQHITGVGFAGVGAGWGWARLLKAECAAVLREAEEPWHPQGSVRFIDRLKPKASLRKTTHTKTREAGCGWLRAMKDWVPSWGRAAFAGLYAKMQCNPTDVLEKCNKD